MTRGVPAGPDPRTWHQQSADAVANTTGFVRCVNVVCKRCGKIVGFVELKGKPWSGMVLVVVVGSRRGTNGQPEWGAVFEYDTNECVCPWEMGDLPWYLPVFCPRHGEGEVYRRDLAGAATAAVFSGDPGLDQVVGTVQKVRVPIVGRPTKFEMMERSSNR